jgi:hypothetical protein
VFSVIVTLSEGLEHYADWHGQLPAYKTEADNFDGMRHGIMLEPEWRSVTKSHHRKPDSLRFCER